MSVPATQADCSGRFKIAYFANNICVFAEIGDDEDDFAAEEMPDSVEIFFDIMRRGGALPVGERVQGQLDNWNLNGGPTHWRFRGDGTLVTISTNLDVTTETDLVSYTCRNDVPGRTTYEIRIAAPEHLLLSDYTYVGFALAVNDVDGGVFKSKFGWRGGVEQPPGIFNEAPDTPQPSVNADTWSKAMFALDGDRNPPTADFVSDLMWGYPPLAVAFTDRSDPGSATITNWVWDLSLIHISEPTRPY